MRRLEKDLAAGGIEVAGHPHEAHEEPVVVDAVDLLLDGDTPLDGGRFGRCKERGLPPDLLLRNPGDLFHLLEGIFIHPLDELVPSVGMVLQNSLS